MSTSESRPDKPTRDAERAEAGRAHVADRDPTPEEEEVATHHESERSNDEARSVADHEREMAERGVKQQGEGRIE